MQAPLWAPLRLAANQRVVSYQSPHAAIVESATEPGERSLVQSALPLQSDVGGASGAERPVDLTLRPTDGGFAPDNPLVETAIGGSVGDLLTLPESGISVSAGAGSDTPALAGDRVFFANLEAEEATADTDLIVRPEALGAQIAWQLRSAASPQQLPLRFELPAGGRPVQLGHRSTGQECGGGGGGTS